jgi:transposase
MNKTSTYKLIKSIGIDTSKNFMQVYGCDSHGGKIINRKVPRDEFLNFMPELPRCLVGMEACSGSHYWGRELRSLGFEVKIISPKQVKAFVPNQKNDAADAQACCEAAQRKNVRAIAIKTPQQQDLSVIHNARECAMQQRIQASNQARAILAECGIAIPQGIETVSRRIIEYIDKNPARLSNIVKSQVLYLLEDLRRHTARVDELEKQLLIYHKDDVDFKRLLTIPGIGTITASAILMIIGNPFRFRNGRAFAAYLGLVPRQLSTGGKTILGRISKTGDRYIRKLLVQGGISVLRQMLRKDNAHKYEKVLPKLKKRSVKENAVSLANKNARIAWAVLTKQTNFQPNFRSVPVTWLKAA